MSENNGIIKTITSAGVAAIIGILFYYFMTAHFAYLKESNEMVRQSIKTQQELVNVVDRLDRTISSKSAQAELRSVYDY